MLYELYPSLDLLGFCPAQALANDRWSLNKEHTPLGVKKDRVARETKFSCTTVAPSVFFDANRSTKLPIGWLTR